MLEKSFGLMMNGGRLSMVMSRCTIDVFYDFNIFVIIYYLYVCFSRKFKDHEMKEWKT